MSTTGGTRGGGGVTNSTSSMHLTTSKQEPLTSIVVIKTETGSLNSGNIMGVSDELVGDVGEGPQHQCPRGEQGRGAAQLPLVQ